MITKEEIEKIQNETPLLSEGFISPSAIATMGKNEKKRYFERVSLRFRMEEEYQQQNKTPEEKKQDEEEKKQKEINSRINQVESIINTLKDFPQVQSKRSNKLKRTYLHHVEELRILRGDLKKIKK